MGFWQNYIFQFRDFLSHSIWIFILDIKIGQSSLQKYDLEKSLFYFSTFLRNGVAYKHLHSCLKKTKTRCGKGVYFQFASMIYVLILSTHLSSYTTEYRTSRQRPSSDCVKIWNPDWCFEIARERFRLKTKIW